MKYKLATAITAAVIGGLVLGNVAGGYFAIPLISGSRADNNNVSPGGGVTIYGIVHYTLRDPNGNIIYTYVNHNRITDGGEGQIAKLFAGSATQANKICVGVGTTTAGDINDATPKQATLETAPGAGSASDICKADASVTDNAQTNTTPRTIDIDQTWTGGTDFAAGAVITESVLSDTDTAGLGIPTAAQTFSRQTFSGIPVANNDQLTIKWTITITEEGSSTGN